MKFFFSRNLKKKNQCTRCKEGTRKKKHYSRRMERRVQLDTYTLDKSGAQRACGAANCIVLSLHGRNCKGNNKRASTLTLPRTCTSMQNALPNAVQSKLRSACGCSGGHLGPRLSPSNKMFCAAGTVKTGQRKWPSQFSQKHASCAGRYLFGEQHNPLAPLGVRRGNVTSALASCKLGVEPLFVVPGLVSGPQTDICRDHIDGTMPQEDTIEPQQSGHL